MDKIKILVVDDEARMRKLVKDFLSIKAEGHCADSSGCDDAEDGRLGGCEDDPQVFAGADHHADGERRGERRAAGL